MKNITMITLCAAAMTSIAFADEVRTNDGSVYVGTITSLDGDNVKVNSATSKNEIVLKKADVTVVNSAAPISVRTKSGETLNGMVASAGTTAGTITVGGTEVALADIEVSWDKPSDSPEAKAAAKKEYKTTLEAGFGVNGQTGNTEAINGNAHVESVTANDVNTLKLYAKYSYGKLKDTKTGDWAKSSDNLHAGFDFKSDFYNPIFWYTRTDLGFDRANNTKFFDTSAAGLGWNIIKEDNWKFSVRGGISYRYEKYKDYMGTWAAGETHDSTNSVGMDFGLSHEYDWEHSKIVTEITYTPAFEDFWGNYMITHETYYQHQLQEKPLVHFRVGVKNEYRSLNVNKEHLDTYYYASLVFAWK